MEAQVIVGEVGLEPLRALQTGARVVGIAELGA